MRIVAASVALAGVAVIPRVAAAEWRPPDVRPAAASLATVLDAYVAATGTEHEASAQRRERWTYRNGERRLPVRVAVRGADFKAVVALGTAEYAAGRSGGTRWRADANGVTHAVWSDDQGDAIDRLPQSIFPFDRADCAVAGRSARFGAAWVVVDRPPRDKPHWFYIDDASGLITHEITREGKRTIVTAFTSFEVVDGVRRPNRWHVSDGDAADDLDVTVDVVTPQPLGERDVAIPQAQRLFVPVPAVPGGVVRLPAVFRGDRIFVDVGLGERRATFVLDTGTASIIVDRRTAARQPSGIVLEHTDVSAMNVGGLALSDVSALAVPVGFAGIDGLLGYDFFLGHVVHVDYAGRRVEVMTPQAAQSAFTDPRNTLLPASFDEGIPLLRAAFGPASGDRFALDTGSPSLFVFAPFERRYAPEIDAHWTPSSFGGNRRTATEVYLEGSIVVAALQVSSFTLGPGVFRRLIVGAELPNPRPDAIDVPLDGIIGTNQMAAFEWWFDYDRGRIALRRNNR